MKKFNYAALLFIALLTAFSFTTAYAQDEPPPPPPPMDAPNAEFDRKPRPNLMAELNLTKDQMQQIKRINQEKKEQMRAAQDRLRDANRQLDEAIYADAVDDATIQARLREVQAAHNEVFKLRSANELAIRRILTPEQLVRFREVRRQFMERMENRPDAPRANRPRENQNRPFGNRPPRPQ